MRRRGEEKIQDGDEDRGTGRACIREFTSTSSSPELALVNLGLNQVTNFYSREIGSNRHGRPRFAVRAVDPWIGPPLSPTTDRKSRKFIGSESDSIQVLCT